MQKDITIIKAETLLLYAFKKQFSLGVTYGLSEEQFQDIITELENKTSNDSSIYARSVKVQYEGFESAIKEANKINSNLYDGIRLEIKDNKKWAIATYELKEGDYKSYRVDLYPAQLKILDDILEKKICTKSFKILDFSKVSDKKKYIAKKVAAFFINDLIERYVKHEVEEKRWPMQCKDVDEYIFKRNIAECIDQKGTAQVFKAAYVHAITTILQMLAQKEDKEEIKISNNPRYLLAHANFKNLIMKEEFKFLQAFVHHEYKMHDASITVTIKDDAKYSKSACVFSDPYGEWSDDYKHSQGIIGDDYVYLMDSRTDKW